MCRFGSCKGKQARAFLATMTLPFDETSPDGSKASVPLVQKNKGGRPRNNAASVIYAGALQLALHGSPLSPVSGGECINGMCE